ncbi:hypothetical protein TIFTF001_042926, partial [Ficus carica]
MKVVVHMLEGGEKLSMPANTFASMGPSKTTMQTNEHRVGSYSRTGV